MQSGQNRDPCILTVGKCTTSTLFPQLVSLPKSAVLWSVIGGTHTAMIAFSCLLFWHLYDCCDVLGCYRPCEMTQKTDWALEWPLLTKCFAILAPKKIQGAFKPATAFR